MVRRIRRIVEGRIILMNIEYKCKLCDAKYNSGHIMDLINHQLWRHQELLKPSDAINRYDYKVNYE